MAHSSPRSGPPNSWFGAAGGGIDGTDSLFACCYAPEFPAQALLRLRPHLQGPVAVLEGNPPHERVCAGNAASRRNGLLNGMSRVEAESFAAMIVLRRSEREEAAARAAMLATAARVSPYVEPRHTDLAAVCVLDITGMARLYHEPLTLARALKAALQAHGIHVSVAVSCNFHTACLLVRGKPGITVVAPGEEAAALAPLLLACLDSVSIGSVSFDFASFSSQPPGLGESGFQQDQLQTLALWGIRTLGALAALPEKQLIARLGQPARRLRELARGEHPHLFAPIPVPRELREEFTFEAPVRLTEPLLFVLSSMLEQLLLLAREQALALASVTVTFALDAEAMDAEDSGRSAHDPHPLGGPAAGALNSTEAAGAIHLLHSPPQKARTGTGPSGAPVPAARANSTGAGAAKRTVRPTVPTQEKRVLLKLFQLELASRPLGAPVLAMVAEGESAKTGAMPGGRFSPPLPEPLRLDVTVARLSALVGEGRVGSPVLRDTHAPDSFSMEPFRGCVADPYSGQKQAPAIRLLRPPEPVQVRTEDGRPVHFWFRGELFRVCSASGPWRMNGDWWHEARMHEAQLQGAWSHEVWDLAAERGRPDASGSPAAAFFAQRFSPYLIHAPAPAQLCCRLRRTFTDAECWAMEGLYD